MILLSTIDQLPFFAARKQRNFTPENESMTNK